jgi:polyhydroxybutyrate depolymerase
MERARAHPAAGTSRRRAARALAAVTAVVLALSGCTSQDGGQRGDDATSTPASTQAGPSPSPTAAAPPRAGASPGCSAEAVPLRAGRHTLTHQGVERSFLLALAGGAADGPRPVVLNLHGMGSGAAQQAAYSRLPELGTARGYIVLTPQAAPGRNMWTYPGLPGPDDAGFLGALLDHVGERLCVDQSREFAAGMSNGAGVSVGLICALDGRLAGIAPVAGVNIMAPCPQGPPTTIVAFHGTDDQTVPYDGGHPFRNIPAERLPGLVRLVQLLPVDDTMARWATIMGCDPARGRRAGGDVLLREYGGCQGEVTLRLYTVEGGGHTWPGPIAVARLGPTTTTIDATRLLLDAFDAAPSRPG